MYSNNFLFQEPLDTIDLTREISANEIRYHPPRRFNSNSNDTKKRFDIENFSNENRERNRNYQTSTPQTRQNNTAINRQQGQRPYAESGHQTKSINPRDPRLHAISMNQKYYGAQSSSSYHSTQQKITNLKPSNDVQYNVLPSTSRVNVPPPNFKITSPPPHFILPHQSLIPSPPRFNIVNPVNIVPNQNVQRALLQQFQRKEPATPVNSYQTAQTYKEYKEKKYEEREAKRQKTSRFDSRERVLVEVPLCDGAKKQPEPPRKKSIEVILSPKPIADISSSSQSSVHGNVQPLTITRQESSNKLISSTSSAETPSNHQLILSERALSTEKACTSNSSRNNLLKSIVQSSILKEQLESTAMNSFDDAWTVKEECESDFGEEIFDGASVHSSNSDINLPEKAPCEDFVPLNIKEEPIDPPANVNLSVNIEQNKEIVEDIKPEIKIEPKLEDGDDDLSTEPEDEDIYENVFKGDSDPDTEASDSEDNGDKIDLIIKSFLEEAKAMAEIGLEKSKIEDNLTGILNNF